MLHFKTRFTLHDTDIVAAFVEPNALAIPGTHYILDPDTTISTLAKAAGLRTFDTALPQTFFDDYHARHGQPPRGVWSYDQSRIFGEFISLTELLIRIGAAITAHLEAERARIAAARNTPEARAQRAALGFPE